MYENEKEKKNRKINCKTPKICNFFPSVKSNYRIYFSLSCWLPLDKVTGNSYITKCSFFFGNREREKDARGKKPVHVLCVTLLFRVCFAFYVESFFFVVDDVSGSKMFFTGLKIFFFCFFSFSMSQRCHFGIYGEFAFNRWEVMIEFELDFE